MNNDEFKFQVAGPYQPVEFDGIWVNAPRVATTLTAMELAHTYYSILLHRGHAKSMERSMRHAAMAMGEVDEPDETQSTYNPLFSAGLMGIGLVIQITLKIYSRVCEERTNPPIPERQQIFIHGAVVQLLFALGSDDNALAQCVRHKRTGYLGSSSKQDRDSVEAMRKFVIAVSRLADEIEAAFKSNQFDMPLQAAVYGYDSTTGKYYWSSPILIPEFDIDEDCA